MLLVGKAGRAIGGLEPMPSGHEFANSQQYDRNQLIRCLERNRKHMRYEFCSATGCPIVSGVQDACRNLTNDSSELTGMSWTRQEVQGA
jgi:hypothetical protein